MWSYGATRRNPRTPLWHALIHRYRSTWNRMFLVTAMPRKVTFRGTDYGSPTATTTAVLFYSILFNSIPFHSMLFYSIPFYSIPFYSILFHCILFHCIPYLVNSGGSLLNIDERTVRSSQREEADCHEAM